jgi:hypothetical protein
MGRWMGPPQWATRAEVIMAQGKQGGDHVRGFQDGNALHLSELVPLVKRAVPPEKGHEAGHVPVSCQLHPTHQAAERRRLTGPLTTRLRPPRPRKEPAPCPPWT